MTAWIACFGVGMGRLAAESRARAVPLSPAVWSLSAAVSLDLDRVRSHDSHPVREDFSYDRDLNEHGVANLEPGYWFSSTSFKDSYTKNIWWPHLADRAGAVGAQYSFQPMAFAVHAEYINRLSVVIVDRDGVVRFAYYGTYWGGGPPIHQLMQMVRSGNYSFDALKRLKPASKPWLSPGLAG